MWSRFAENIYAVCFGSSIAQHPVCVEGARETTHVICIAALHFALILVKLMTAVICVFICVIEFWRVIIRNVPISFRTRKRKATNGFYRIIFNYLACAKYS